MHLLDRRLSYHLVFFKSHVIQPSRAESIAERKDSSRRHTNLDTLVVAGARTSPMPPQHAYTLGMYYRDSTYTHELPLSLSLTHGLYTYGAHSAGCCYTRPSAFAGDARHYLCRSQTTTAANRHALRTHLHIRPFVSVAVRGIRSVLQLRRPSRMSLIRSSER